VKKFLLCSLLLLQAGIMAQDKMSCQQAFQRLLDGNKRFREDASIHPDRTAERRLELTQTQAPFACIVGCADSRVAPDIIFDQGIGDLFVVRIAGNVIGPIEMESVEYSVHHLGACMIIVMGHENCGAVNAVMQGQTHEIEDLAKLINPVIKSTPCSEPGRLECLIKANAKAGADMLRKDKKFAQMLKDNKLMIVAGYYNFHSGQVEILN
jgi:carbonic anhydrase